MTDDALRWNLFRIVLDNTGLYPLSTVHYNSETGKKITEERTEEQNGYNRAVKEIIHDFTLVQKLFWSIGKRKIDKLIKLHKTHSIFIFIEEAIPPTHAEDRLVFAINCNDLFYWACADAEEFTVDEIDDIYNSCYTEKGKIIPYGAEIYACKKRNLQPQKPIKERMIELGCWVEELDALPEPEES